MLSISSWGNVISTHGQQRLEKALGNLHHPLESAPDTNIQVEHVRLQDLQVSCILIRLLKLPATLASSA
jgi:hypothetical protein